MSKSFRATSKKGLLILTIFVDLTHDSSYVIVQDLGRKIMKNLGLYQKITQHLARHPYVK